jgi:hypothetical protein
MVRLLDPWTVRLSGRQGEGPRGRGRSRRGVPVEQIDADFERGDGHGKALGELVAGDLCIGGYFDFAVAGKCHPSDGG